MSVPAAPDDPPELEAIFNQFTGKLAFDVGANVGRTALSLADRFSRVIALEPAHESFDVLRHMICDKIMCLPFAASDSNGEVELAVCPNKIDTGQLVTTDWMEWGERLEGRLVPAITLDTLAACCGTPDFIKCDVEGHEVAVIEGATHVLHSRPALFLEVHSEDLGKELWSVLSPLYPDLHVVLHPHYGVDDPHRKNHFWLVASKGS